MAKEIGRIPVSVEIPTYKTLKSLSSQVDKSMTKLITEAVQLLLNHYTHIDESSTIPT